jgi:putative DNA primase/helicase
MRRLGLAEGNESALSAMQMFDISCWATLGNERFGLVTIPESVRELHLFVDNDAGGRLAEERAREAYALQGGSDAEGRWSVRDAHAALELAQVLIFG